MFHLSTYQCRSRITNRIPSESSVLQHSFLLNPDSPQSIAVGFLLASFENTAQPSELVPFNPAPPCSTNLTRQLTFAFGEQDSDQHIKSRARSAIATIEADSHHYINVESRTTGEEAPIVDRPRKRLMQELESSEDDDQPTTIGVQFDLSSSPLPSPSHVHPDPVGSSATPVHTDCERHDPQFSLDDRTSTNQTTFKLPHSSPAHPSANRSPQDPLLPAHEITASSHQTTALPFPSSATHLRHVKEPISDLTAFVSSRIASRSHFKHLDRTASNAFLNLTSHQRTAPLSQHQHQSTHDNRGEVSQKDPTTPVNALPPVNASAFEQALATAKQKAEVGVVSDQEQTPWLHVMGGEKLMLQNRPGTSRVVRSSEFTRLSELMRRYSFS